MLHKTFDAIDIKADGDTGEFTATVAAFGNVDLVGDRILPGAFSKSIDRWRASGDPIPIILSHQHENPMSHIGVAYPQDVQETAKGLFVKGTLDIGDNEVARQVHKLMKRRSLKEFSFGYKVPKGGEQRAKDGANDLSEIDLFEAGPTLKGANPDTELHGVKSALSKQSDSEDEQEPADDQPPTSQQARILNSMVGQAQEYIDSNPDAEDASEMADILDALKELQDEPSADSGDPAKAQTNLSQSDKDAAAPKAQPAVSDNSKSAVEDARDKDRHAGKSRKAQDLLRRRSDAAVLEIQSDGMSLRKPPKPQEQAKTEPLDEVALKRRSRETMLAILTGADTK